MLGAAKKKFDRRRKLSKRRAFQISASVVATTTAAAVRRTSLAATGATVARGKGIAAAAPGRGQSQSQLVRGFFSAQFAPFLHRNSELFVDGFDNFLGNPLVHSCLKGTNNSRNLFSNLFQ